MTSTLRIYNTLTRSVAPFAPLVPGEAKVYSCGPTVYNFAHLGNFRYFVFTDLLRQALRFAGLKVTQVMNITDVDDKTIANASRAGLTLRDYTDKYTAAFFEDVKALRIDPAEVYPRATEHIDEMIGIIRKLEARGLTYVSDGSVYFAIAKFPGYGRLSGTKLEANIDGARVDSDEYEKTNAKDFVLWKARKEGEPSWQTPYGEGRPGWHLECSAMSAKYLGPEFDIHTGAVDLIFPHHENEIAQSEGAEGRSPSVHHWVHCSHLIVEGEKMSKSRGNYFTLRDILEKGYPPETVRYLLLTTHYRKNLDFTFEGLKQARHNVDRIRNFQMLLASAGTASETAGDTAFERSVPGYAERFRNAILDDLNVSEALAAVFDFMSDFNRAYYEKPVPASLRAAALGLMKTFDSVLKILEPSSAGAEDPGLTEKVEALIEKRRAARAAKDWAEADRIRDELKSMRISIEDTKDGVKWRKTGG